MSPVPPPGFADLMEMISSADGHTHVIAAAELNAGMWEGHGRYRSVCGREVLPASLITGPGPRCPDCPPLAPPEHTKSTRRLVEALSSFLPEVLGELRQRFGSDHCDGCSGHYPVRWPCSTAEIARRAACVNGATRTAPVGP